MRERQLEQEEQLAKVCLAWKVGCCQGFVGGREPIRATLELTLASESSGKENVLFQRLNWPSFETNSIFLAAGSFNFFPSHHTGFSLKAASQLLPFELLFNSLCGYCVNHLVCRLVLRYVRVEGIQLQFKTWPPLTILTLQPLASKRGQAAIQILSGLGCIQ